MRCIDRMEKCCDFFFQIKSLLDVSVRGRLHSFTELSQSIRVYFWYLHVDAPIFFGLVDFGLDSPLFVMPP